MLHCSHLRASAFEGLTPTYLLCVFCFILCAVTATLLNFVRLFRKAHEENLKQAELDKKKVQKEAETENAEGSSLTKKGEK